MRPGLSPLRAARARFSTAPAVLKAPPAGFTYFPNFLSRQEQLLLTRAALDHLDNAVASPVTRKRRKRLLATGSVSPDEWGFLPEKECYDFEEGHFDGVIRHYREARITDAQWASFSDPGLQDTLAKVRSLLPPQTPLQTHVLHLSERGEILPHIDNVEASGSIILGVSLGAARVLQLEDDHGNLYCHLLEPGSCYIQR
ncbi:hypothetical protein CPB86DRAFT_772329 [Serendipita vermifera]|nr:hypothetical protein CPB86DRAFT_772329 [Serendipita vermifera]